MIRRRSQIRGLPRRPSRCAGIYTSPGRRAELIGREAAPLAVEAGPVIFGDPGTRFTESIDLLPETIARLRTGRS
jgi:hypothetical protein